MFLFTFKLFFSFICTVINQGWVVQIASQTQVNEPFSSSEHSPFDNDLLDSKEVQQLNLEELEHGHMKGSLGHL